jgi:hypothetical protein
VVGCVARFTSIGSFFADDVSWTTMETGEQIAYFPIVALVQELTIAAGEQ